MERRTSQIVKNKDILQITNRHVARMLVKLNEIDTPIIIQDAVKSAFWQYAKDIEDIAERDDLF